MGGRKKDGCFAGVGWFRDLTRCGFYFGGGGQPQKGGIPNRPEYPEYPDNTAELANYRAAVARCRAVVARYRAAVARYRAAVARFTLFWSSIWIPKSAIFSESSFIRLRPFRIS